jgi:GT2 family glycosyltransferase
MIRTRIALVVPIHNGLSSTQRFLAALHSALELSVLRECCTLHIVDDGSSDGSASWITDNAPDAILHRGDGTLWWSGAVNLALETILTGDYSHLLLFNNDNIPRLDYFSTLAEVLDQAGTDQVIAPKVINTFPTDHLIYGGVTFSRRSARYIVNPTPEMARRVNTAGGMGVLVPLQAIRKAGLFDAKHFPQKSGDTDFYLRAERAGYHVQYCPSLVVYNDNRTTGFSDNTSFRGMLLAYTYPKGYMNLKVDARLLFRHANPVAAILELLRRNGMFLGYGLLRIMWRRGRKYLASATA